MIFFHFEFVDSFMMMEQNLDLSNGTALQHNESPRQILGIPPIPVTKKPYREKLWRTCSLSTISIPQM